DRSFVQEHRLKPVDKAANLAFADQVENAGIVDAMQAVRRFHRLARTGRTALRTNDGGLQLHTCAHSKCHGGAPPPPPPPEPTPPPPAAALGGPETWSSDVMPADTTALPHTTLPYATGTGLPCACVLTGPVNEWLGWFSGRSPAPLPLGGGASICATPPM